jgi:hypothetical protein
MNYTPPPLREEMQEVPTGEAEESWGCPEKRPCASQRQVSIWHLRQLLQIQPILEVPREAQLILRETGIFIKYW